MSGTLIEILYYTYAYIICSFNQHYIIYPCFCRALFNYILTYINLVYYLGSFAYILLKICIKDMLALKKKTISSKI